MGGCTSKPKVLEGTKAEAKPFQKAAEEPHKVVAPEAVEEKRVAAAVSEDYAAVTGDEDGGVKSRSLGNLLLKNEEEKDSHQSEAVKDSDVSEVKQIGAETVLIDEEQRGAAPAVDALAEKVTQSVEAEQIAETSEKKSEEVKPLVEAKNAETSEEKSEEEVVKAVEKDEKGETSEEKSEEVKAVEKDEKGETSEKTSEEVKPAPEVQNAETSTKTLEEVSPTVEAENAETSSKVSEEVKVAVEAENAEIFEKKLEEKTELAVDTENAKTSAMKSEEVKPGVEAEAEILEKKL